MALKNYRVVLRQTWAGHFFYSMFNYFDPSNGEDYDAAALNTHFRVEVLPTINAMQHNGIQNVDLYCVNTTTGLSSDLQYLTGTGTRTLAATLYNTPYITFTHRWQVGTTQYGPGDPPIKVGYSRIVGATDNDTDNGRLISTFKAAYSDAFYAALDVDKTVGSATYVSCIHRPGTAWKIAPIVGFQGVKFGSQNTRK